MERAHEVAAAALAPGDRFLVPKGGVIAVDARLAPRCAPDVALLDESLLTGESRRGAARRGRAHPRRQREPRRARSRWWRSRRWAIPRWPSIVRAAGARAGDAAAASRAPRIARRRGSSRVILVLAADHRRVAWWSIDPTRAFAAVLAVLVVTCPCALSLATPAALAAATTRLARLGVLVTRADAIERLARVDTVVWTRPAR